MNFKELKFILILFLPLIFISCTYKNPITNVTSFDKMISDMVDKSLLKEKKVIFAGEYILVSDFVNLNNLQNKSQFGFLLSNILKNKLSSLNIVIKEIELGKEFQFGESGFNLLTRKQSRILSNEVKSKYAVVGTYSISNKSLNLFIKLIEIDTGYIVSSAFARTDIDDEIINLEESSSGANQNRIGQQIRQPLVL